MRKEKLYIIFLLMISLAISSLSYAFYLNEKTYQFILNQDDYEVEISLLFNQIEHDMTSVHFDIDKRAYEINLFDFDAENYIENINLILNIDVPVASRMRFKIKESYELTRYYQNQEQTVLKEIIYMTEKEEPHFPFSLLKKGDFQNYFLHTDGFYYINDVIDVNQTYHVDLIHSGISYPVRNNSLYYETCYLYLSFEIELLQANRVSQVWQIDPSLFIGS